MKTVLIILCLSFTNLLNAQNSGIGIGTSTPDPSAALDLSSTTGGFLMPRMKSAQRQAIANPATGLLVFDIDKNCLYLFDGTKWAPISYLTEQNVLPFTRPIPDGQVNDHLGFSVAMDSNYAAIGSPLDSILFNKQGAVYVFKKDSIKGWQLQAKLTASEIAPGDCFGYSVSMKGNYLIVGKHNVHTAGSAYVFFNDGNNWIPQGKLIPSDGAVGDRFGSSVAIYNDCVVVGAPGADINANVEQGAVYIYLRNGNIWTQQTKLTATDGVANDEYGGAVTVSEKYIIAGAPHVNLDSLNTISYGGIVYTYLRNGTAIIAQTKLIGSDFLYNSPFGNAVAVSGDNAVVGAYYEGGALVFQHNDTGWVYQTTLAGNGNFEGVGKSVAISGNYLAVGAVVQLPPGLVQTGAIFCYKKTDNVWNSVKTITKVDPSNGNYTLGSSVAIDGNTLDVLTGAPGDINGGGINQTTPVKGTFYFTNLQ